ncbi:YggS family pyridoxal phosphate-dependent enzyme [uncultured Chloroflexus sp.]|uniref:YggS family pyridoxal phosphate-dependent enzyme n=1 Tax=uncultured Chloroflexus sp. TaxID=214040 RepID=UPI002615C702|nr:YggS family pyridoxal phosphate-dependent enzyme [uncultured Chloroflexus sp.]
MNTELSQRLAAVQAQIAAAAAAAGRSAADVQLIAVSKTHPPEVVAAAVAAGVTDLGENRVQEAHQKISALHTLRPRPRWHLIGHLQRNKAKLAVELFDLIHSVDSLRLAETLDRHARERDRQLPILLQINVSGEASKEGFWVPGGLKNSDAYSVLLRDIETILSLPALEVRGLMTIAPIVAHPDEARPVFAALRELRDDLARRYPQANWRELSMGMSDDLAAAIAEGATMVRIGRAIFGERQAG